MENINEKFKKHNNKWTKKVLNQTWDSCHLDLLSSKNLIYNPSGFQCSNLERVWKLMNTFVLSYEKQKMAFKKD